MPGILKAGRSGLRDSIVVGEIESSADTGSDPRASPVGFVAVIDSNPLSDRRGASDVDLGGASKRGTPDSLSASAHRIYSYRNVT
jgi:hypothetical protein